MDISALRENQQRFFDSGQTLSLSFRKQQLKKLLKAIDQYEDKILDAMEIDLKKPRLEAYGGEIGFVKMEIRHTLSRLGSWMKDRRVSTPLLHFPSWSWIRYRPKGTILILAPWNYPFNLLISPLVGAIAAGNCAVVKPSEKAPATANVLEEMIRECFDPAYITMVKMPGKEVIPRLIDPVRFDHIFFTGSEEAGRLVYTAAAKQLIPVTLEMGGKSPALVLDDAHIDIAAKRIAWAKAFNAGQTCVTNDYVLVPSSLKEELVERMRHHLRQFFGDNPLESPHLAALVTEEKLKSLAERLKSTHVLHGGAYNLDTRKMEPTLVELTHKEHPFFTEEIFGPVLPVISYETEEEALRIILRNPNPLSFYLHTRSKKRRDEWLGKLNYGGAGVNTAMVHVANMELPFGGVFTSGMGRYHGRYSFEVFSHSQGISQTALWPDISLRYPPYGKWAEWLVRKLF
jgi:aldehyde dehydrogenase (NAD+)